jgi:hypothetical protein
MPALGLAISEFSNPTSSLMSVVAIHFGAVTAILVRRRKRKIQAPNGALVSFRQAPVK